MKIILIALTALSAALAMAEPVLLNGDFFQRNDLDEPTHWRIRHSAKSMEKERLVSANDCILSLGGSALQGEILVIQPNIKLDSGKKYRVSYEARSENAPANLRIYLQYQQTGENKPPPVTINGNWKKTGTDWAKDGFTFDYPDSARSPWFVVNVSGNNRVMIRNLKFEITD